jgi:phosphatidylinositol-3-phosphatase
MRRRTIAASALVAIALALAIAAGGHPLAAPQHAGSRTAAATVTVTMTASRCGVSQATVPVGPLVFRLVNRTRRARIFEVGRRRSAAVRARRTGVLRLTLSIPGTYRYACTSRAAPRRKIVGILRVTSRLTGASHPCGTSSHGPAVYEHVVWVVMENRAFGKVIDTAKAPYINRLAHECGLATRYYAVAHPSLPNYIALTSGDIQGIQDDLPPASHPLHVPSIFSQLGSGWRSLQESMPGNCWATKSGLYAVKHDPAPYYVDIRKACARQDVPLMDPPDVSARFTFITPDLCNDMHSCTTAVGDRWLATWMPKIFKSPEYESGSTAVFLTWDEDDKKHGNHIPTLVISPSTPPGTRSSARFNHYSLLRTTEELLGIHAYLGRAASATSMRAAFHL